MTLSILLLVSAIIAVIGFAFILKGIKHLIQLSPVKALSLEVTGIAFLAVGIICFVLAVNLYTYQSLVYEKPVVEISFEKVADKKYIANITALDSNFNQTIELQGDEWQLDAQVLSWKGYIAMLGITPYYRLHRISGRYTNIKDERKLPRSVESLLQKRLILNTKEFDFWQQVQTYSQWTNWGVEASYGSAVYLPMVDKAHYKVALSRTGLVARPANSIAKKAIKSWIDFK